MSAPVRRVEQILAWLVGLLEVLSCMALAAWILTLPSVFGAYYPLLGFSSHSRDAQAVVDWLQTDQRQWYLHAAVTGGELTPKELGHFADVRRVFRDLPKVALWLGALAVAMTAAGRLSGTAFSVAQVRGLVVWLALVVCLGGLAYWDWKLLFAWVHRPLFGEHSWRFADSAYSLQLFPQSFWRFTAVAVLLTPAAVLAGAWCANCLAEHLRSQELAKKPD